MNSGRRFQRHTIEVYLSATRYTSPTTPIDEVIDGIVEQLDSIPITPEQFRGFSYNATRHAIETALVGIKGGEAS